MTGHPCNGKWTFGRPEESGPAKELREIISSSAEETDLPLTTHTHSHPHTQIKYKFSGQPLTKAKLLKETVQKMLYTTYYLEETSIIYLREIEISGDGFYILHRQWRSQPFIESTGGR